MVKISLSRTIKVVLAVLWTAFIIYALTKEPSGIPKYKWLQIPGIDKVVHFVIFAIEALLLASLRIAKVTFASSVTIILFCAILGGGLELVQHYYVDGRSGDAIDWIADALGAVIGMFFVWKRRENNPNYGIE